MLEVKHAEGRFGERVHSREHAARVGRTFQVIESLEQGLAVLQAIERHAVQPQVRHPLPVRAEGLVRGAEKSGRSRFGPFHVTGVISQGHEGRNRRLDRTLNFGNDRADAGPAADRKRCRGGTSRSCTGSRRDC